MYTTIKPGNVNRLKKMIKTLKGSSVNTQTTPISNLKKKISKNLVRGRVIRKVLSKIKGLGEIKKPAKVNKVKSALKSVQQQKTKNPNSSSVKKNIDWRSRKKDWAKKINENNKFANVYAKNDSSQKLKIKNKKDAPKKTSGSF